ncbi:MAG: GNAT family N-acetyltransferase, partial [Rhodobacterales bacterium]|nr:GNAT family N-acetyltransferase [Rhodobacterales bacterium]
MSDTAPCLRPHATLHTMRLVLRPPELGDAPALADGIGNYDVVRWLGRISYPYDIGAADRFIAGAEAGRTWVITEQGALIGGISADAELGFWLARPAWGRGLATEACDAVLDAWFADPGQSALPASHFVGNDRSARVLIKQGFRYTGKRPVMARALGQEVTSASLMLDRADWQARRRYRLTTPRLTIRELAEADISALRRIAGQDAVARMLFQIPLPWPEAAARRWLDAARFRGRLGFWAGICQDGALIGAIGIAKTPGRGTVRCMYFLDPAHWGQGLAKEALVHFLTDTMARFHVETIWADHFDDNPASGAVLRHAGFARIRADTGVSAARSGEHPLTLY